MVKGGIEMRNLEDEQIDSLNELYIKSQEISACPNDHVLKIANDSKLPLTYMSDDLLLSNIISCRSFLMPNSRFGTRLGASINAILDCPNMTNGYIDFLCTDSQNISKNKIHDVNTCERLAEAKNRGAVIIAMFGGSTTMGNGARLPNYTIPSLVEKILYIEHKIDAVCINFGIVGNTISDCLNLLISEGLRINPTIVTFYTGWNCSFNFQANIAIRESINSNSQVLPPVFHGMNLRHVEHDIALHDKFMIARNLKKYSGLIKNKLLDTICHLIGSNSYIKKSFNNILLNDTSVNHAFMNDVISTTLQGNIDLLTSYAADEYLAAHEISSSICKSRHIQFHNFFQPTLFWGKKKLTDQENKSLSESKLYKKNHMHFQEKVCSNQNGTSFHDLSQSFENVTDQVYTDTGHKNPYGNFLIANEIAQRLSQDLI